MNPKYLNYIGGALIATGITQLCIEHDTLLHTSLQVAFATGCLIYCGLKYHIRKFTKKATTDGCGGLECLVY